MLLDMDRDDVPHFMEGCEPNVAVEHPDSLAAEVWEREWLWERGLVRVNIPFHGDAKLDTIVEQFSLFEAGVILGCSSERGNHSVVIYKGRIYNPNYGEVVGPMRDGFWWVTVLSVSTQPLPVALQDANVAQQEERSNGN
jgi:hypothetical protein